MTSTSYLRFPHVSKDEISFVAQDDVWLAPVSGGRAWRLSTDGLPPKNPRFSPDGKQLSWTVTRGEAPELVTMDRDGGPLRQITYWGHPSTLIKGYTPEGRAILTSSREQGDSRITWAYSTDLETGVATRLPFGPVDSVAYGPVVGDERPVVLSSVLSREPAWWKRYKGGTAGKLWIDADGSGEFVRLVPELDGNLCDPLWVDGRIAFLSDHEGHGNLYSVRPDGSELRRHTDFEDFYVRHASTDGHRVVFESAGRLFLLNDLDSEAVELQISLGTAASAGRVQKLNVGEHLGEVVPARDGRSSLVEAHGTIHLLTHSHGPSRVIAADLGVRARLPRHLDPGHVLFVSDEGGAEALYIRSLQRGTPAIADSSASAQTSPEQGGTQNLDAAIMPAEQDASEPDLPRPVSAQAVNNGEQAWTPRDQDEDAPAWDAARSTPDPERPLASQATEEPTLRKITYPSPDRASQMLASPDGKFVALGTEFGALLIADVGKGQMHQISQTLGGPIDQLSFSPDSQWIVWVEPVGSEGRRSKLRIRSLGASETEPSIDLTDGRFGDHDPQFTPDGKFLAFLSERSFDPVYSAQSFDLAFPVATKPYLLALAANTASPFGPSVEGAKHLETGTKGPSTESEIQPVRIDFQGLSSRVIAVPVVQGRYSNLEVIDSHLLWRKGSERGETGDGLATPADSPAADVLERFDLTNGKVTRVLEGVDRYAVSADGKWIVTVSKEKVGVCSALADTDDTAEKVLNVDLDRIVHWIDPIPAWGQAFDEAWRLQRDFFFAEDMAGIDWEEVRGRYRPIVDRLGSHNDLVDLIWELHGELGTSHAYVTPAPVIEDGAGAQGLLGAQFSQGPDGWEIAEILGSESSDPQAFSPLNAPGADARVGDVLEAINGTDVPLEGPGALLAGTAGKIIELTLRRGATGAGEAPSRWSIAVVPVKSEERLRYQEWVGAKREVVHKASNGTFGYLHIPDMVARGWAQLHRDLERESALDALVIDVRRNRGGHTSQLVAELIGRRMDAWSMVRHGQSEIYPANSPRGPVVLIADEFAGSDGDIITAVAKLRGIGPVVGMRTWGGVVGIDGRFSLADGTEVTQPRYAYWFKGGQAFSVENYGVDPDIEVAFPPHEHGAGNDPQLEAAIGVLREMQKEIPTVRPPAFQGYRNAAAPKLPPRP